MKNTVKHRSLVFVLICILLLAMTPVTVKAQDSASIKVGSASGEVGDQVTISVTVSSSAEIGAAQIYLKYDTSVLTPVSGYSTSQGGVVSWVDSDTYTSKTYSITFQIVGTGTGAVSIYGNTNVASMDGDYMKVTSTSGSVTGNATASLSSDNALSSLSISPGVLSPAFSANVTEYTTSVDSDCDKLVVSAIASDSSAKVSVSGTRMDVGSNTTTITVTAENGSKKVYKIYTTKEAAATEAATTQVETQAVATQESQTVAQQTVEASTDEVGVAIQTKNVTVAGAAYEIDDDYSVHKLPDGYEEISYDLNGLEVQAGKGTTTKLILVYLKNTDGNGTSGFYVYDAVTKSFTQFHQVEEPDITYVILPITDSMEKPEGFLEQDYTVDGISANVLMDPTGTYLLFYGVSSIGVTGWFQYNISDGTIQPYLADLVVNAQTTQTQNTTSATGWMILSACLGVIALGLLIAVIVLARKTTKNKKAFVNVIKGNEVIPSEESTDILENSVEDEVDALEEAAVAVEFEQEYEQLYKNSKVDSQEDELISHISRALTQSTHVESDSDDDYDFLEVKDLSQKSEKENK